MISQNDPWMVITAYASTYHLHLHLEGTNELISYLFSFFVIILAN